MPCYSPKTAGFSRIPTKLGKYQLSFSPRKFNKELAEISIPCGKCIGCRIDKSLSWAVRMEKESKCHKENCFVTLTYNNENLPKNSSLVKTDLQNFIKRLRKRLKSKKILYYGVGEYGDRTNRPHYHVCIFGHNFNDRDDTKPIINGDTQTYVYRSKLLEELWTKGHSSVGDFNFKTAAYCARYVTKKIYGEKQKEHYGDRTPEFALMSLKPAIGRTWLENNLREVEDGKIFCNGKQTPMPRYYSRLLNKINPNFRVDVIINNHLHTNSDAFKAECAPARLKVKRELFLEKAKHILTKKRI